jgi:UDP-N-acetylmuramoylalanine--D-glutamate ligase
MKLLTKRIGILGYGVEGKSLAKFLESRRVRDLKIYDEKNSDFPDFTEIGDRDVVIRSPGVSPHHDALQNFRGKVMSGAELFLQLCPTKKVIGITGTKGKGTASTMVYRIFEEANDTTYLVGNIGTPFFDELPNMRTRDVVVAELSSFQLWDCQQSPQIAVMLRISPDHLERHLDFDEYISAKKNIFLHQKSGGRVVYCADCETVCEAVSELDDETLFPYSMKKELEKGAFLRGDEIVWRNEEGEEEVVATKEDVKLRGEFNLENVLAAIAASKLLNVRTIPAHTAIQKFTGLPYRMQLVAISRNGIQFWNDSLATTPSATSAGLSTFDEPVILIAGGFSKNTDYAPLGKTIADHKHIKKVMLIGNTGPEIETAIKKNGGKVEIEFAKDFADIFKKLKSDLKDGDNILLSPASSSFDMFKNEFDRAEKFNAAVNEFLKEL